MMKTKVADSLAASLLLIDMQGTEFGIHLIIGVSPQLLGSEHDTGVLVFPHPGCLIRYSVDSHNDDTCMLA
jgi:hypothetical protein